VPPKVRIYICNTRAKIIDAAFSCFTGISEQWVTLGRKPSQFETFIIPDK